MKLYLLALCGLITANSAQASQYLFVSHKQSPEIISYKIDEQTGKLTVHHQAKVKGTGGFMRFNSSGSHVYVNNSVAKKSYITTLAHKDGKLSPISSRPCGDSVSGIEVHSSGNSLVCSHYSAGKVTSWKINDKAEFTGESIQPIETTERAHYVVSSPNENFMYAPHTRPNSIFQFAWSKDTGELSPLSPNTAHGPKNMEILHEPRHLAFHPTLKLAYSSNERGGAISSWDYSNKNGQLKLKTTTSTIPPNFTGVSSASDIKLSTNGKFAYVANRTREEGAATVASFQIDLKTGDLTPTGHTPIGEGSRALHIDNTGHYLYATGTNSDNLFAFRIHQKTGKLSLIETYKTKKRPFWLQSQ